MFTLRIYTQTTGPNDPPSIEEDFERFPSAKSRLLELTDQNDETVRKVYEDDTMVEYDLFKYNEKTFEHDFVARAQIEEVK